MCVVIQGQNGECVSVQFFLWLRATGPRFTLFLIVALSPVAAPEQKLRLRICCRPPHCSTWGGSFASHTYFQNVRDARETT